jgi:hypothetical protein
MRRADEVVSLRTGICARSGSRVGEACPARHAEAYEGGNGVKGAPRRNELWFCFFIRRCPFVPIYTDSKTTG